jgi:pyruvate carboxylase
MPGAVVSIAVKPGQRVAAGSQLLALEAMKMEMNMTAERDCVIERVLVTPGARVQAKDLLIVLKAPG